MLELGIEGGRATPLQKRTIGTTNISDVFDGVNHIWPTRDDVAYFYDFNSIQLRFIWSTSNGRDFNISTAFRYGYVAGNSEKRGQQFIRSYVSSRDGQAADEEFAVVNYFDKTEAGQVVALNPIT